MLDYIATGRSTPTRWRTVVAGVHEGCRQAGCALIGGETAEHAGVTRATSSIWPGSPSASWKQGPSSPRARACRRRRGRVALPPLRSNGLHPGSAVLLERAGLELEDPAWTGADHSVADELLRPSVIYTPAVLALRTCWARHSMPAPHHGRRIVGNLPRALPDDLGAVLERSSWEDRRCWRSSGSAGGEDEMDRVFNRGVAMPLVLDAGSTTRALRALERAGSPPGSSARSSLAPRGPMPMSGPEQLRRAARPPPGALVRR